MMSGTGCAALSHEEQAVKLLNEKYESSFEVEKVQSHRFFSGYYTVIAYQKDNSDLLFQADVNGDGSGVSDNYVSRLVCRRMADTVSKNLNQLPGVYYVFCEAMIEPSMLKDTELSLEEFLEAAPENKFYIYINYCPDEDDKEQFYQTISKSLEGLGDISGHIRVYLMDEPMLRQVQDYMENHDKRYDEYEAMTDQYHAGKITFKNGVFTESKETIQKLLEKKL